MTSKSFFQLLISLILIFSLTVLAGFAAYVTTSGGSFLGYEFNSVAQKSHLNVALMGLDKDGTRTDVLIVGQINMIEGEINMLQIPRDTYMPNNGRSDHKINSAYGLNKEKTVSKEIKDLLGIHIDKYVTIDIRGFRDLIDTIGGVDFYVPQNMHYDDDYQNLHIHLNEGQQHLDGDKAEQLVRFRNYPNGDLDRMKVQSDFIQATIDEIFRLANVAKINDMVEDFSKTVKTNFSFNEMLTYAPYVLATDRDKIVTHHLVGDAQYIGGVSYVLANRDANRALIEEHFTPATAEKVSALDIKASIVGNGAAQDVGNIKALKTPFNSFTSVDIIDASGGSADVSDVKDKLKEFGYNVMSVTSVEDATYDETVVVASSRGLAARSVANILGLSEYIHNSRKKEGSDITIVLGVNAVN